MFRKKNDLVIIRDKKWYTDNADEFGSICDPDGGEKDNAFIHRMSNYCGMEALIERVDELQGGYRINLDHGVYLFNDFMFEEKEEDWSLNNPVIEKIEAFVEELKKDHDIFMDNEGGNLETFNINIGVPRKVKMTPEEFIQFMSIQYVENRTDVSDACSDFLEGKFNPLTFTPESRFIAAQIPISESPTGEPIHLLYDTLTTEIEYNTGDKNEAAYWFTADYHEYRDN